MQNRILGDRSRQSSELIESFRSSIFEAHERSKLLDSELKKVLVDKLESIRSTGVLIQEAQAALGPRQFAQATGDILNNKSVKEYLSFVRRHPHPITEKDLPSIMPDILVSLRITNALSFPDGHGPQALHSPSWMQTAAKLIMAFVAGYKKFVRLHPVSSWDRDTREQFIYSLKPLLAIHREVMSKCGNVK